MTRGKPHIQMAISKEITDMVDRMRPSTVSRTEWLNNFIAYSMLHLLPPGHYAGCEFDVDPNEHGWFEAAHERMTRLNA
jgi:hypothetical protein